MANYNPTGNPVQRLLDVGIDQFFDSANDLVVPSEGGWRVDRSGATFIPGTRIGCFGPGGNLPGESVTHVNFFAQPGDERFLVKALLRQAAAAHADRSGDQPAGPSADARWRRRDRGAAVDAPAWSRSAGPRARLHGPQVACRAETESNPAQFSVTVVNGDLTFEPLPLLVGHYRATGLTGTEARHRPRSRRGTESSARSRRLSGRARHPPDLPEQVPQSEPRCADPTARGGHRRRPRTGRGAAAGRSRALGPASRPRRGRNASPKRTRAPIALALARLHPDGQRRHGITAGAGRAADRAGRLRSQRAARDEALGACRR